MELMKSMGKLKSTVGERSRKNVEPTPKHEVKKKVMRINNGKICTNNSRSCMEVHTCKCTEGCTFSTASRNEGERITMKKEGEYYSKFGTNTRRTMTKISSLSNGLVV